MTSPADWEQDYSGTERMWSGRANAALVDAASDVAPGRSLDLGCGEGADVIWLATRGWRAEGVDLSPTAIDRAQESAADAEVADAAFHVGDLLTWDGAQACTYDLVTTFFLHTRDSSERQGLLRKASEFVAPGGLLLVVAHATMPPWAGRGHDGHSDWARITPESDRDLIATGREWETRVAEIRERRATGPGGEEAVLEDSVLLVRRAVSAGAQLGVRDGIERPAPR